MAELHSQAVPVQTLYTWFRADKLIVNRRYQRKLVWTLEEKQKLIDSLLSKYPIPAILLTEIEGPTENYEIIDGLQRMHAILSFIETSYPLGGGEYFDLNYFPTAKDYAERSIFPDQSEGVVIDSADCSTILNYQVSLSILRKASDLEVNEVFDRINTYGHRLSDQERRQAGVQSNFSELIRKLASEIRGDASPDRLYLYDMPSISIDLPKTRHGYDLRAEEVFWVFHGILRSTDLRDSEDEQCIADAVGCLIGPDLIERSKTALDSVYDEKSEAYRAMETALQLYGSEKLEDEFKFCLEEITKICEAGSDRRLRSLLFEQNSRNPFPSVFVVLLVAIFECGVRQEKRISSYGEVNDALAGVSARLQIGQKGANPSARRRNIDTVKGLIGSFFEKDPSIAKAIYKDHTIVDIESGIRRSETELPNYELKQGILPLTKGAKDPALVLEKIVRTICAIANNGPDGGGKILIGVADTSADAERVREIDGTQGKAVGSRVVVGISREAARLGISTEEYVGLIVSHIKNSKLSESAKTSVLSNIDFNPYYGLGVIVLTVPPQRELTYIGDQLYRRDGSSNSLVSLPKEIVALSSKFKT